MHCQVLIPDLLWREGAAACRGLALPALHALTARGQLRQAPGSAPEAWLCRAFGVEKQNDWPVAPLTLQLDGGSAGSHYWLRADPVHLHLLRDRIVLADSGSFAVSQQEAARYTEALNLHFQQDGLVFYAPHPARWYLRLATPPRIDTAMLSAVTGRSIADHLARGEEAVRWHGIANEIQMLLHHHPDNEAREARGEASVNSVWLWGGGTLPQIAGKPYSAAWANDALARALALASGGAHAALPPSADAIISTHGNQLVLLDQLHEAALRGDAQGYRERLAALERDWFAPLKAALQKGRIAVLTLVALDESGAQTYTVRRGDLWKLWCRKTPLYA